MSHVPDDPTKVPNQKPGDFPDKTKKPGHHKELDKRADKRPGDPAKPGQAQTQKDPKTPNDQNQKH